MEVCDIGKLVRNLNPVNGCSIGCTYCYARKINTRFKITEDFSIPEFKEERIKRIFTKTPNTYLMTSMSDFSGWKPEWRDKVFDAIKANPQHVYLFLTKQPEHIQFESDMENVWMGVTVTNCNEKHRILTMRKNITVFNYFITFEPLFGDMGEVDLDNIGWVVIGTETGKRKGKITAQKDWILSLSKQAEDNNIPVFMKSSLVDIVGLEYMKQELPHSFCKH